MEKKKRHIPTLITSIFQLVSAAAFLALIIYFVILFLSVVLNDAPAENFSEGIYRAVIIIVSIIVVPVFLIFLIKNIVMGFVQLKNSLNDKLSKRAVIGQCVVSGIFLLLLFILLVMWIITNVSEMAMIIVTVSLMVLEIVSMILVIIDYNRSKKEEKLE